MRKAIIFALGVSCISGSASQPKKLIPRTYNPDATQKLQEKINTQSWAEPEGQPNFLKEVDKLIKEGADPNVKTYVSKTSLLDILVIQLPLTNNNIDWLSLENVLKNALDNGAQVAIDSEQSDFLIEAVLGCSPNMIKMLVDSGTNQQQRDNNTNAALRFSKKILARDTEILQKTQKKIDRLQKIVDLLEGKQTKS